MSAFVCSDKHISAIVNACRFGKLYIDISSYLLKLGAAPGSEHKALFGMLLAENVASVNWCYGTSDQPSGRYDSDVRVSTIQAMKLIECYQYQSCEHVGWGKSEAKRFTDDLMRALVSKIPGYDTAEWSI